MRKIRIAAALTACLLTAVFLSGCVKIIPKGTEAEYTGATVFDASAEAAGDWAQIVADISAQAQELSDSMISAAATATAYSVTFTGTVTEYNTDTPKGYLRVDVDGLTAEIQVQVGSVYSGTAVRDAQSVKSYESFTNQTEWSAYARTVNNEVQTNVIDPLGDLSALTGKEITVLGCFSGSGDPVVVTPVSIETK